MRHVFILNPAAGKKKTALELLPQIEKLFSRYDLEYAVHVTDAPGQATAIARAEVEKGDAVRLYACGGDGTMLEVASGMEGAAHAQLACVPCGSANDFIRFMPNAAQFRELERLVAGEARSVDAIRCNDKLSLNLCCLGVDADVGARMSKYKHLPLVSGPMAYNLALVNTFFRPLGRKMRVVMETTQGWIEREGVFMFALAANGQYYGGGYHGSPLSQPDDGLLDFILIHKISHLRMLAILGKYKRGEHLGLDCCESFRGTSMEIVADRPAIVNADGECVEDTRVRFEILPAAISFVYPAEGDPAQLLKKYEKSVKTAITP